MGGAMFGAAALALVVISAALLLGARVYTLRGSGVPIIMRYLPAGPDQGWRHGTVRYDDHELRYFRLSSVRLGPSWTLARGDAEVVGRRSPEGTEREVIDATMVIVHVVTTSGDNVELAFARDGLTAFQSWLESRPSPRRERLQ